MTWTPLTETNYAETTHDEDHVKIHKFINQHVDTQYGQFDIEIVDVAGTYTVPRDWPVHHFTLTADTTFTFQSPTKIGQTKTILISGEHVPTFPSNIKWLTANVYAGNTVYGFTTFDGGTTWYGSVWQVYVPPVTPPVIPPEPEVEPPPVTSYDILVKATVDEIQNGTILKNTIEASSAVGKTIAVETGKYRIPSTVKIQSGQTVVGLGKEVIIDGSRVKKFINVGDGTSYTTVTSFQARDNISIGGNAVCDVSAIAGTNLCFDRDRLWFDDVQGTIVATKAEVLSSSSPYAYWLDRGGLRIYVKSAATTSTIELDTIDMFTSDTASTNDATIDNLIVQKFATPAQRGALGIGGNRNTIKNCTFRHNHALGIYANTASNLLVDNCYFYRNGQMGAADYAPSSNTTPSGNVWANSDFEENNTDDFYIGDWEAGGWKSTSKRGGVVRNCTSLNDKGLSYWVDFGEQWIIEDNVSTNAYAQGIRFEVSANSVIRRNTIVNSGHDMGARYKQLHSNGWHGIFDTAAISVADSRQVEVYENTVTDPNTNGIIIALRGRGSATKSLDRTFVHHNYIEQRQVPISINDGTGSSLGVFTAGGIGEANNSSTNLIKDYYGNIAWSLPQGSGTATTKQNQFSDNTYVLRTGDTATRRFVWFSATSAGSTTYRTPVNYATDNPADATKISYT